LDATFCIDRRLHRGKKDLIWCLIAPIVLKYGWLFASLTEVREVTHQWIISCNEERPHDALGNLPAAV
jgi:hypothetical protein